MKKNQLMNAQPTVPRRIIPGAFLGATTLLLGGLAACAADVAEPVGNVASWIRQASGIELKCGGRQAVRIDILTPGLFRVRFAVDGEFAEGPLIKDWGLIRPNESFPPAQFQVNDAANQLQLATTQLRLELTKTPLRIAVFDCQGHLLARESAAPGMSAGAGARMQMEHSAEEHFFGLGEGIGTFNPAAPFRYFRFPEFKNISIHGTQLDQSVISLDQAGKRLFFCLGPNWAGQCMAPAVIPFFMSTRGYGIYLNEFRDSVFDLGCTRSNAWSMSIGGPPNQIPNANRLDYYFIGGPSFQKILDTYTDLTGRTPLLPKWSLGYLQICNFNQKQAEVSAMARDFRQRDFPCDMLLLEPGWMKTPYRMDGWSPERFPDPATLIADLQGLNFRLGLWQCGPADWVFTSWDLLKRQVNQWGVDITHPAEAGKYQGFHQPYYEQGIAFFKQDGCGQSEWQPDESYHNGLSGKEMHNIIPTLYSRLMAEASRRFTGRRGLNFNPMVGPSQQRFPGIWPSGDGGGGHNMFVGELNLGLSGHSYTTHDFTDRSPAGIHWSLLGPWCPGALSEVPRSSLCQSYLKLRYQLIPYLYNSHHQAHITGRPYFRAMVLEYQDDPATYALDRQCLLGDWFLLAAYTKDVYLPAGRWIDYWSGEVVESRGQWRRDCRWPDTAGGPLFVKGGAIIPMGPVTAFIDQEPLEIVRLDVYPHGESRYEFYEDDGITFDYEKGASATTLFRCRQSQEAIQITLGARQGSYRDMPQNRDFLLSVHCPSEPTAVQMGKILGSAPTPEPLPRQQSKKQLFDNPLHHGWYYDAATRVVWIKPAAGWHYTADLRGQGDPEQDTVRWIKPQPQPNQPTDLWLQFR